MLFVVDTTAGAVSATSPLLAQAAAATLPEQRQPGATPRDLWAVLQLDLREEA